MHRSSVVTAITVLAAGLVALQYWNAARPKAGELPPLARDLPKDGRAADAAFKARVAQRFPAGSPAADIEKELSAEGFKVEDSRAGWRSASLKRTMYPCNVVWAVSWRGDAVGKVAEIQTRYGLRCP